LVNRSYGPVTSIGCGRSTEVKEFFLKPKNNTASSANFYITDKYSRVIKSGLTKFTTQQPITKFGTHQPIKQRHYCLGGWSSHYYLSPCCGARAAMIDRTMEYGEHISMEEYQNESK
jgi:hypothetical protein